MKQEELEWLMDTYGDQIVRLCYMYLKDWHLAEEATQETFIKVYKKYDNFRNESSHKTWMMTIAINTCKSYRRTAWFKKVHIGLESKEEIGSSLEEEILESIEKDDVLKAIYQLESKYKEVILLYYYQEMTIEEIARVLQIKSGNVKMRLQRGRKKLGEYLSEVGIYA